MGNNRLIREKWDFSRLAGSRSSAPTTTIVAWPSNSMVLLIVLGLGALLVSVLVNGVASPALALGPWGLDLLRQITDGRLGFWISLGVATTITITLWLLWMRKPLPTENSQPDWIVLIGRLVRFVAIGLCLSPILGLVISAKFAPELYGLFLIVLLAELAYIIIWNLARFSRTTLHWMIGISATMLLFVSASEFVPNWLPKDFANPEATRDTFSAILSFLSEVEWGARAVRPALIAVLGASVVSLIVGGPCKCPDLPDGPLLRMISGFLKPLELDVSAKSLLPKLEIVGSEILHKTMKSDDCKLVEIWISRELRERHKKEQAQAQNAQQKDSFDRTEMLHALGTHVQADSYVVLLRGNKREVFAYSPLGNFIEVLLDDAVNLVALLRRGDADKIRDALGDKSQVFASLADRNGDVLKQMMVASMVDEQLLVRDKNDRFAGFCTFAGRLGAALPAPP